KQGFSTVKDASKNNSDSEPFYSQVNGVNENDMLVGFVPSNIPGMNYSIWISSVKTNRTYLANYALDGWTSHIDTEKTNGSYDYYVVLVNDDLKNIANTYGEKKSYIVNYKYKDFITRGYITSNASETPKFNNIYKRFYNTGFNAAKTSEYLAIYIDAFNPLCSSFAHFGYNVNLKIGHMNSAMPFNSVQADVLGPQQSDYKTFTNQNTRIDTWDVNTIGYDQTANLFYYSFSGYHKGLYVYFTSFYYMKLTNEINVNPSIVRNGYVEESRPYTITSVPFSTYQNTNQSYLVKTYINDRNSGSELLSRPTNQNVRYEKVQDGAIKFSSISNNFKNMETQISKSDFLTSRMVSAYSEQEIKNLVKEKLNLEKDYDIQIKNIDANDNTGTISFSVDIAVHNSLDTDNQNSMSVFNLSQIIISGGYKLDDLILSFKNDEAINDIKQKYNIDSIIETN
ncbi:MAG: hypothetical protein K2N99_01255, partial [Malacoplasma sp.]|nr:hypothetical protein [Malacoplasma sp.]